MKYRDHKGSLNESMKTQTEFHTISDIINHLNSFYNDYGKKVVEIKFKHLGYDSRIDWNTYYVLQRYDGEKSFTVAGMSDGILKSNSFLDKCRKFANWVENKK